MSQVTTESFADAKLGTEILERFRSVGGEVGFSYAGDPQSETVTRFSVTLSAPTEAAQQILGVKSITTESGDTESGDGAHFSYEPLDRGLAKFSSALSATVMGADLATSTPETIEHLGLVGLVRDKLMYAADMAAAVRSEKLAELGMR